MAGAQDWQIRSRAHQCLKTEKPFTKGDEVYSRLLITEEGYVREDFNKEGWEHVKAQPAISTWKSDYEAPAPPKQEAVQKENAESLLRKLIEQEDDKNQNTIYILSVMLERKRLLIERDVQKQPNGEIIRVYEYKQGGETFLIHDPKLKLAELEAVQIEVVAMLGGGKEKPTEAPTEDSKEEATEPTA